MIPYPFGDVLNDKAFDMSGSVIFLRGTLALSGQEEVVQVGIEPKINVRTRRQRLLPILELGCYGLVIPSALHDEL